MAAPQASSREQAAGVGNVPGRPRPTEPTPQLHNAASLLLSRFPHGKTTEDLSAAFQYMVGALSMPKLQHDRLSADARLTPQGVSEGVREHARTYASKLRQMVTLVETERDNLSRRRTALLNPKPEPGAPDLGSEIRSFLRSLQPNERRAVVLRELGGDSPLPFLHAINGAPLSLSGVDAETFDRGMNDYLKKNHEPELRYMGERAEAVNVLAAAVRMTGDELHKFSGLPEAEFAQWLEQVTPPARPSEGQAALDMTKFIEESKRKIDEAVDRAAYGDRQAAA